MALAVLILMLLLTVGFLGTRIASQLRVPHSVFLVVVGVAAGLAVRKAAPTWFAYSELYDRYFPQIVLYVLLPPLIFESAYNLDFAYLKRDVIPLTVLACVAMALSTLFIGFSLYLAFGLELLPCLTFGALISATDPVAVVALFKEVGAPKRLTMLIEGESLLNDGTAIVLFRALLLLTMGGVVSRSLPLFWLEQLVGVVLGGVLVGLAVSLVMNLLLRATSNSGPAQLGLTVAAGYLSFLLADRLFGVSGVISTMTVGLYLGRRARLELNKEALEGMSHLWELLALVTNILVFFAVGFMVDSAILLSSIRYIPLTLAIAYLARAVSVYSTIPVVNRLGLSRPIRFAYQTVLFWGGLRGGLALGLVLMLPDGFPHKQLFVALAIAVVFSTLFINAMTTARILKLLKLDRMSAKDEGLYRKSLELAHESVFSSISRIAQTGALSLDLVERQRDKAAQALGLGMSKGAGEEVGQTERDARFAVSAILMEERRRYEERLQEGALSRAAYRQLIQSVVLRLEMFEQGGVDGASRLDPLVEEKGMSYPLLEKLGLRGRRQMIRLLSVRLETLLYFKLSLLDARAVVSHPTARALSERWDAMADEWLRSFYQGYPHYAAAVQTLFVSNAFRAGGQVVLERLIEMGLISRGIAVRAQETMNATYRQATNEAWQLLRPSAAYLLARLPMFKELPKVGVRRLVESSKTRVVPASQRIVKKGEKKSSLFLIVAGIVELEQVGPDGTAVLKRLFTGDTFGERSLLREEPQADSVTAVIATEILEIDSANFQHILYSYPYAREAIYAKFAGAP